jgi:nucleotide-binding universal stress UspA family protein
MDLARGAGAKLTFVTVTEPFHVFSIDADQLEETPATYRKLVQERAARILAEVGAVASPRLAHEEVQVEDAEPYRAIIRVADERGCDLIVMASHGRRGVAALVLGSETIKVLTHSTIPVLVYRARRPPTTHQRHLETQEEPAI